MTEVEENSQPPTPSLGETGSKLGEESDWLPQESKVKAKKRRADYQQVESTCSACE